MDNITEIWNYIESFYSPLTFKEDFQLKKTDDGLEYIEVRDYDPFMESWKDKIITNLNNLANIEIKVKGENLAIYLKKDLGYLLECILRN